MEGAILTQQPLLRQLFHLGIQSMAITSTAVMRQGPARSQLNMGHQDGAGEKADQRHGKEEHQRDFIVRVAS